MANETLKVELPRPLKPFAKPARHKVAYGGRGGAKSWSIARLLLVKGIEKKLRILCAREVQRSLKDSVQRLLLDQIDQLGLSSFYTAAGGEIRGANGTLFLFTGLADHTVASIKSYESVDICWVEEAQAVSAHSANVLIPTIRAPGSEIWWSYNPDQANDYVHKRFVVEGDETAVVCPIGWRDNKWRTPEMDAERERLKALNDDLYRHIWEGECRSAAGLIFKRDWFRYYDEIPDNLSHYLASDYAVTPPDDSNPAPDWTEHGVFGLDERGEIWIVDWWSGQTAPEEWIEAAIQLIRTYRPQLWFDESGVIRRAVDAAINRRMRERNAWVSRQGIPSASGKAARALGFAARASAGVVHLPKCAWSERLVNQLCAFTGEDGRTDDMVDVCSLIARGLDLMGDAMPLPKSEQPPVPFSDRWFDERERQNSHVDRQRAYR